MVNTLSTSCDRLGHRLYVGEGDSDLFGRPANDPARPMRLFGEGKVERGRDAKNGVYLQQGAALREVLDDAGNDGLSLVENDAGSNVGHISAPREVRKKPQ